MILVGGNQNWAHFDYMFVLFVLVWDGSTGVFTWRDLAVAWTMNISQTLQRARETLNLSQQQIADLAEVSVLFVSLCEDETTDFLSLTETEQSDFRKVVSVVKSLCERVFIDIDELHWCSLSVWRTSWASCFGTVSTFVKFCFTVFASTQSVQLQELYYFQHLEWGVHFGRLRPNRSKKICRLFTYLNQISHKNYG